MSVKAGREMVMQVQYLSIPEAGKQGGQASKQGRQAGQAGGGRVGMDGYGGAHGVVRLV